MQERTCVLAKPDTVCRQLTGAVMAQLEKTGLRLRAVKMVHLRGERARDFYREHIGKPFYEPLIRFMTSAPIVAMVWEGPEAVTKTRAVMGATNSPEAVPGTIRREFGTNNRYNAVHGSDSAASAEREIRFFFEPDEIFAYEQNDWKD